MPAQFVASPTGAADLVAWASTALSQGSAGSRDLRAVGQSCLDLTAGHPSGVAGLLLTGTAALSAMLGDGESRPVHLMRVRRFRLAVTDLDDRGLHGGYLVAGLADLADAQVPVLLKQCMLRPAGGDATVTIAGPWRLNPALVTAVQSMSGGAVDLAAGFSPGPGGRGFVTTDAEPYPALDQVAEQLAGMSLEVRRRLVIAPVTMDSDRALADLERVADLVREHPVLAAVTPPASIPAAPDPDAADPDAADPDGADPGVPDPHGQRSGGVAGDDDGVHTVGPGWRREDVDIEPGAATALDAAMDEVLAIALDRDQRESLRHVLMGRHVVIDSPPATGGTAVATAVAVLAVTTGRRCLLLTPTRTQGDVVVELLRAAGIGDHMVTGPAAVVTQPPSEGAVGGATMGTDEGDGRQAATAAVGTAAAAATAAAERDAAAADFDAARDALTEPRPPWQVSRLNALNALAGFEFEPSELTADWPTGPAGHLPVHAAAAAIDAVARAVVLGAADEAAAVSPWRDAVLSTPLDAARVVELVTAVSGALGERARVAIAELAALTGTSPATTLSALRAREGLFTGLQSTLDRLTPEVFDIPVGDLVVATGSREFRERSATSMPPMTRRRMLARARRLVRPGVVVEREELHELLVTAAAQRASWQELSGGAGWAHVPADVPQRVRVLAEFADACEELGRLHPGFEADAAVDDLIAQATRLSATTADVAALPEVSRLTAVWTAAGLGPVVRHLFERLRQPATRRPGEAATAVTSGSAAAPRDGVVVRAALWRAYWTTVAAGTTPAAPLSAEQLLDRHATAEAAYRDAAPDRVRGVVARASAADPPLVRVAVPADLAGIQAGERHDVIVIDDAGEMPFAHVVAAIARAGQVVALGEGMHARPGSAWALLSAVPSPLVIACSLRHRHRPVAITHAAGARGDDAPAELPLVDPRGRVTFTHLPQAFGLPGEGEDYVETSDAEVAHVVQRAMELAGTAASAPRRSLAVIALTRTHAAAIALGLRAALRSAPERAAVFASDAVEPVVVVSADQARGIERDVVLLSVGFPRTPHGRVLHRFGPLDAEPGAGLVATAVTRARHDLHVVSGLRAADLDPSRLRSAGARAVSALLVGAELAAAAGPEDKRTVGESAERDTTDLVNLETGSCRSPAVLRLVALDLHQRGLTVAAGPCGAGLTITGPTGERLVVDLDIDQPDAAAAQVRRRRLAEGGWRVVMLGVEEVAADRVGSLGAIADLVSGQQDDGGQHVSEPPRPDEPTRLPPTRSADDSDLGWSETTPSGNDQRLQDERPPHW